jgi:uncharacterized protein (UPF0333 family)
MYNLEVKFFTFYKSKFIVNNNGQAIVEAALFAPLIVFFLVAVIWFARISLTYQQIVSAARYGADLIAYTSFSEKYIKNDVTDYLCNVNNIGRILDKNKLDITVFVDDYKVPDYFFSIDGISTFDPQNAVSELNGIDFKETNKSFVEITYRYRIPKILGLIGKKSMELKVKSEVLSKTGSAGELKRDK